MNENNLSDWEIAVLMSMLHWSMFESEKRSEHEVISNIRSIYGCIGGLVPEDELSPEFQHDISEAVNEVITNCDFHEAMEKLSNDIIDKIVDTGIYEDRDTFVKEMRKYHRNWYLTHGIDISEEV